MAVFIPLHFMAMEETGRRALATGGGPDGAVGTRELGLEAAMTAEVAGKPVADGTACRADPVTPPLEP